MTWSATATTATSMTAELGPAGVYVTQTTFDIVKEWGELILIPRLRAARLDGVQWPRHHRLENVRHGFQQMARLPAYRGVRRR